MLVILGSDHAGFALKSDLIAAVKELGHTVEDLGTDSTASVDYPDYGTKVAHRVVEAEQQTQVLGVCVCGSGIGIAMAANKVRGARAAVVHDVTSARLARQHNQANVACIGARLVGHEVALDIVATFLGSEFAGGRHAGRVDKLNRLA